MRRARRGARPGHRARVRTRTRAYLVFVALDDDGNPRPVPPLVAETEQEQRRQREAKLRRQARLAHKEAVQGRPSRRGRRAGSHDPRLIDAGTGRVVAWEDGAPLTRKD